VNITSSALAGAAIGLIALLAALIAIAAGRKASRAILGNRRDAADASVRPALFDLATEETDDLPEEPAGSLRRAERRVALHLLERVRGGGRERLLELLAARGDIAAARRRTRRPGAIGRAVAAAFLGHVGSVDAADDLIALLSDPHADVRNAAARALGQIGDPGAVPALLAVVDGPAAASANVVASSILRIGRGAIEPLREAFPTATPATRTIIFEALGLLGAVAAIDDFASALEHDADVHVRVAAAEGLGRIGLPRGVPSLTLALEDRDGPAAVRSAAAAALARIGAPESVPALARAVATGEHDVARVAAGGLATAGAPGLLQLGNLRAAPAGLGAPYAIEALALHHLAREPGTELELAA
jgi:HEAT repeat protein